MNTLFINDTLDTSNVSMSERIRKVKELIKAHVKTHDKLDKIYEKYDVDIMTTEYEYIIEYRRENNVLKAMTYYGNCSHMLEVVKL